MHRQQLVLSRNVVCVLSLSKRLPLQTAWSLNGPKIPSAIGAIRPCHTFLATPLQLNKRDGTDRVRDRRRRPRVAAAGTVHSALRIDKTDEIEIMHGRSIEGYSLSAPASLLARCLCGLFFDSSSRRIYAFMHPEPDGVFELHRSPSMK